jgi:glutamate racemase
MTMPPADAPLLFFDSGIGGLSVLRAVSAALPNAPVVYAADYAGLPYGTKSEAEIAARVPALLGRLVERYRPRLVTIACNTACTIALSHVRAALDVPVVGTVPAIKPAAEATGTGVIGLLGTAATVRQPYVDKLQADHAAGESVDPAVYTTAMAGLTSQAGGDRLDVTVLGCTHFPLVMEELLSAAPGMKFVDGAAGIARRIVHLTQGQQWPDAPVPGVFVTTGMTADVETLCPMLASYGLTQINSL